MGFLCSFVGFVGTYGFPPILSCLGLCPSLQCGPFSATNFPYFDRRHPLDEHVFETVIFIILNVAFVSVSFSNVSFDLERFLLHTAACCVFPQATL